MVFVAASDLILTVTDAKGLQDTEKFQIIAGSPENVVNITIKEKRLQIENLTAQLENMDSWRADLVKKIIKLYRLFIITS